jgi:hypothetical protein
MKRRFLIIFIVCLLVATTACNSTSKQEKTNSVFNFDTKTVVKDIEDGWIHFFTYDYISNNDGTIKNLFYGFNGYNLKYKHIEGYDIPIIDKETGKVTDTATSSLPYLSLDKDIKPDIDKISDFFKKKQFTSPIKMSELDGLNLSKINKQDILGLFNEAVGNEKLANGKYGNLPEADIAQERLLSGYQWQVGFFIVHGNILKIRIELLYEGNTYLSDLIDNNKANQSQKDIYAKIKEIEKNIISKQSFIADGYKGVTIDNVKFERLYKLLQNVDSGGYKN